jgi:hypothetical protein
MVWEAEVSVGRQPRFPLSGQGKRIYLSDMR